MRNFDGTYFDHVLYIELDRFQIVEKDQINHCQCSVPEGEAVGVVSKDWVSYNLLSHLEVQISQMRCHQ